MGGGLSKIAALLLGDESVSLNLLESGVCFALKRLGPTERILKEQWLFGRRAALEFYKAGIRDFFVPEAGMLMRGAVHQLLDDVRVLYTDKHSEAVERAQSWVEGQINVSYVQGDIANWFDEVLPIAKDFFGEEPRLGIIMTGVTYFLPDELLRKIFKSLYSWAASGSYLAVTGLDIETVRLVRSTYLRYIISKILYKALGASSYSRTDAGLRALMLPWKITRRQPIAPEITGFGGGRASLLGYVATKG